MKAVYLEKKGVLKMRDIAKPVIKNPDDVLVRVTAVGVCGSDIHYYREGRIGDFVVKKPLILGHETAGIVEKTGKAVRGLQEGDRVALEPGVPCRNCAPCKEGRYNLCDRVRFFATPPVDGTFCEYVVHPADFVYPLPQTLSPEEGTLLEPLSVGLHAIALAGVKPGMTVLVTGMGTIGNLALQAARLAGATVLAVDRVKPRLALAGKLGAAAVIDTAGLKEGELKDALPAQPDILLECSGAPALIQSGPDLLKRGGTMVLIGMGMEVLPMNVARIVAGELTVRGLFRYANTYPAAAGLVREGRVSLKPLVNKVFPLSRVKEALEYQTDHPEALKVVVRVA